MHARIMSTAANAKSVLAAKPLFDKLEVVVPALHYIFGTEGVEHWKKKFAIIFAAEVLFFVMAMLDLFSGGRLHAYGIRPREFPAGLLGMLMAPAIHSDITQWLVNAFPFAILSGFVLMREDGITTWAFVSFLEVTAGGLCVWVFGRIEADHNGCGGLIMTYFGYLFFFGLFRRDLRNAIIAVLVIILYGGMFWTTLPSRDQKVSFESHIFGIIIGGLFGAFEGEQSRLGKLKVKPSITESGSKSEKASLTSDDVADDDALADGEIDSNVETGGSRARGSSGPAAASSSAHPIDPSHGDG